MMPLRQRTPRTEPSPVSSLIEARLSEGLLATGARDAGRTDAGKMCDLCEQRIAAHERVADDADGTGTRHVYCLTLAVAAGGAP